MTLSADQLQGIYCGSDLQPITPGTPFANGPCRAILIGQGGTLSFTTLAGTVLTGVTVPAGILPIGARAVASGGSATGLYAIY